MNVAFTSVVIVLLIWGLIIFIDLALNREIHAYLETLRKRFKAHRERYYDKKWRYCSNCCYQGNDGVRTFCLRNVKIIEKYSVTEAKFDYVDCIDSYCEKNCKWRARNTR